MKTVQQRANEWIVGNDTGCSSKTIWSICMGTPVAKFPDYPHDPSDFGRCYRLLELIPEWKNILRTHLFKDAVWSNLLAQWGELSELWEKESPSGQCPVLYDKMQSLIGAGYKKEDENSCVRTRQEVSL